MTERKAVTIESMGIKCDAPECDYHDANAVFDIDNPEEWLDRPCPKCGASLLTQEDLNTIIASRKMMDAINEMAERMGLVPDDSEVDESDMVAVTMDYNGTGKPDVSVEIKEGNKDNEK